MFFYTLHREKTFDSPQLSCQWGANFFDLVVVNLKYLFHRKEYVVYFLNYVVSFILIALISLELFVGPSDAPLASNNFEAFLKVPGYLRPHTQIYCTRYIKINYFCHGSGKIVIVSFSCLYFLFCFKSEAGENSKSLVPSTAF